MFKFLMGSILTLMCSLAIAQTPPTAKDDQQVLVAEVYRRGNMVTETDVGPNAGPMEAAAEVMAPPTADDHKWFVTVLTMKDCPACEALKRDFQNAPELTAFVYAKSPDVAWAHFNTYAREDESQAWRLKEFRVQRFPTIVIQPSLDGKWGDPATVVFQQTGYDGNPKKLAKAITDTVQRYAVKVRSRRVSFSGATQEVTEAPKEEANGPQPFRTPDPVEPFNPSPAPLPYQYPPPQQPESLGILALLASMGGWGTFLLILVNTLMYLWDWYREFLKAQGKTPVLTDAQKKAIEDAVRSVLPSQNARVQ